jgi:hypothetical protein
MTSGGRLRGCSAVMQLAALNNSDDSSGATKAGADLFALSYARSFGLDVTILRPSNVYGSIRDLGWTPRTSKEDGLSTERDPGGALDDR